MPRARARPGSRRGVLYMVVNVGLLTAAMSIAEGRPPLEIWWERFRWLTPYYLVSGPLALALIVAYEKVGITGLLAFTTPPAMMMFSVRQYLARTRSAVEEVREANEELHARTPSSQSGTTTCRSFPVRGRPCRAGARPRSADRLRRGRAEQLVGHAGGDRARRDATAGRPRRRRQRIGGARTSPSARLRGERWDRLREAILPAARDGARERRRSSSRCARRTSRRSPRSRAAWRRRTTTRAATPSASRTSRSRSPSGSATRAPTSTRSRSARSCTTSARSGSPSASSTSPARSTTRSGR